MAKIDPAFQAAPFLGQSSYDPIEFARRKNLQKFQLQRRQEEEQARATAEGLQNLMVNVKGWEDQEGFKEIMADQDKIMNGFLALSRKGMNLVSPKTTQEILAYKAITDAHQQLKQKVDTWNQQKAIYDLYSKAIEQDSAKPAEEQTIDHEATMANIQKVMKAKDILSRGSDLQNLVVTKPQIADVHKYVKNNLDFIAKPNKVQMPYTDPTTGQTGSVLREQMTPDVQKQQVDDLRKLYRSADARVKAGLKEARKQDPTNDPAMPDEEYFVGMYNPEFKQSLVNKLNTKGGGGGISFGSSGTKVEPGELHQDNNFIGNRNYKNRYDFQTNGKLMKVKTQGGFQHNASAESESGGWHEIKGGDYVEAELLFYDADKDELVFRTGQASKTPWVDNNRTVAVPRTNVPDADKLPIMVDGKKKTLKDILPGGTGPVAGRNTVLKGSDITWK